MDFFGVRWFSLTKFCVVITEVSGINEKLRANKKLYQFFKNKICIKLEETNPAKIIEYMVHLLYLFPEVGIDH